MPETPEPAEADAHEAAPPLACPPLELRDGLPDVTETAEALEAYVRLLEVGSGPIAIDTERASGYRYGQSAYLIQIRREGAGTALIDPQAIPGLPGLAAALSGPEWILHAASQDLPCLAELDLAPVSLFDTELAGRLLGMPRVGLGPMVADVLGMSLAKGHGAADWSRRPLPQAWLEYAALDVEVLIELRDELHARLVEADKLGWAQQEFAAVRDAPPPPPRVDPWRRTSGIHKIRSRRGLAIVEQLWLARDLVAREIPFFFFFLFSFSFSFLSLFFFLSSPFFSFPSFSFFFSFPSLSLSLCGVLVVVLLCPGLSVFALVAGRVRFVVQGDQRRATEIVQGVVAARLGSRSSLPAATSALVPGFSVGHGRRSASGSAFAHRAVLVATIISS